MWRGAGKRREGEEWVVCKMNMKNLNKQVNLKKKGKKKERKEV